MRLISSERRFATAQLWEGGANPRLPFQDYYSRVLHDYVQSQVDIVVTSTVEPPNADRLFAFCEPGGANASELSIPTSFSIESPSASPPPSTSHQRTTTLRTQTPPNKRSRTPAPDGRPRADEVQSASAADYSLPKSVSSSTQILRQPDSPISASLSTSLNHPLSPACPSGTRIPQRPPSAEQGEMPSTVGENPPKPADTMLVDRSSSPAPSIISYPASDSRDEYIINPNFVASVRRAHDHPAAVHIPSRRLHSSFQASGQSKLANPHSVLFSSECGAQPQSQHSWSCLYGESTQSIHHHHDQANNAQRNNALTPSLPTLGPSISILPPPLTLFDIPQQSSTPGPLTPQSSSTVEHQHQVPESKGVVANIDPITVCEVAEGIIITHHVRMQKQPARRLTRESQARIKQHRQRRNEGKHSTVDDASAGADAERCKKRKLVARV